MTTDHAAAQPEPIVRVRGLVVDGLIDGLNFDLAPGDCLAILDEHDVCRTALLQYLASQRRPDAGSVQAPPSAAVWHADGLAENEPVRSSIIARLDVDAARADALLADLGLAHRAGHEPWAMSAGERRRIAVHLALSSGARLVVLDEPERGLDKPSLAWLAQRLRDECATGKTIVVATHSEWLADNAATLVVDEL